MQLSVRVIHAFQDEILEWYKVHKRNLPWRELPVSKKTAFRDPYAILVSEIMLQQTQVNRVVPRYADWMDKFPTVNILAKASLADVLHYWSGLGYNRREKKKKKTAEIIVNKYEGIFPQSDTLLQELPGIGVYTSSAIRCFAFNEDIAVIDINVKKVILKLFLKKFQASDKEIERIANLIKPPRLAYVWNQALMDYSSIVLKKEKIATPKQSTFIGSHRYYRGKLLKILLEKHSISLINLGPFLKKNFTVDEHAWLLDLVNELEGEGFIVIRKGVLTFPNILP